MDGMNVKKYTILCEAFFAPINLRLIVLDMQADPHVGMYVSGVRFSGGESEFSPLQNSEADS
jgi:hypothetical protein